MRQLSLWTVMLIVLGASLAGAQDAAPTDVKSRKQAEFQAAADAAMQASTTGPASVPLLKQATLALPEGYLFVPNPQAGALSRALGNQASSRLQGIIMPAKSGEWLAYLDFVDDGHVADEDAKNWNPDDLLQNLKDGTEAANADRIQRGFSPIEVARWIEVPAYDAAAHRLVWSALVRNKGGDDNEGSANYNTYALGRTGHFELDFISKADTIEAHKGDARELLAALNFNAGQRYEDFNPATDKLAAYGLAALIGGVAAKKLGLLALAAGLFVKFAKLIGVAVIALGVGLKKMFGGSRQA